MTCLWAIYFCGWRDDVNDAIRDLYPDASVPDRLNLLAFIMGDATRRFEVR